MKKQLRIDLALAGALLAMFLLAWAMPAGAQAANAGNRITVPLSHPSQPATLRVSTIQGSITVRAYSGNQVIVATSGGHMRREHHVPPEAQGMHQLNTNPGITASEDNNVVTVSTSVFNGSQNLDIEVPVHTSLRISTVNGDLIEIDGVQGDISAENTNGNVKLENVSGSIVASALNGRVTAVITHLDENKPSSFNTMNGTIDLTLPANVHADLRLKTAHGSIYMDNGFQFHPTPSPEPEGHRGENGMFRVQVDRSIRGTLNGGGPEVRVQNFNGDIYIHKGQ